MAKPLSEMLSLLTQQPGESAAKCKTKEIDASVTRLPGNDERFQEQSNQQRGVVDWKTLQR